MKSERRSPLASISRIASPILCTDCATSTRILMGEVEFLHLESLNTTKLFVKQRSTAHTINMSQSSLHLQSRRQKLLRPQRLLEILACTQSKGRLQVETSSIHEKVTDPSPFTERRLDILWEYRTILVESDGQNCPQLSLPAKDFHPLRCYEHAVLLLQAWRRGLSRRSVAN